MKQRFLLWILFLLCGLSSYAQQDTLTPRVRLNLDYAKDYFRDAGHMIIQPIHWKSSDVITASAVLAGAALLLTQDEHIRSFAQRNQDPTRYKISHNIIQPFGSGLYTAPIILLLYADGWINPAHIRSHNIALRGAELLLVSGAENALLKELSIRARPNRNMGSEYWLAPLSFKFNSSMPSGHTQSAFSLATLLASSYRERPWIGITAYTIAGLLGLSRIYEDKHWASDVLIGSAVGYANGRFFFNRHKKELISR